jgi:transmembrane sensor
MSDAFRLLLNDDADARWEAIGRHLAGESAPAESEAVVAWLAAHPEDAQLAAIVKARADRAERQSAVTVDTERVLASVRSRLEPPTLTVERGGASASAPARGRSGMATSPAARPAVATPAPQRWRAVGLAVAAGLAAVVGLSQFRGGGAPDDAPREFRTAVGQRDSMRLADGTTVVLAPGSRLTLAANYGASTREVTLDGAAFFDVPHDETRPFTVHTRGAEIRDLGTAFSVKTGGDGGVSVAVTHGIVSLRSEVPNTPADRAPAELRAGDRGTVAKGTVVVQRGVVTGDDVAWTRGQLAYRDAPLSEVRDDVRRWYGIELQVTDSLLARRTLTATFRGDSAAQVIQLIALALGADAVQRGDTVRLQPQGSATPNP